MTIFSKPSDTKDDSGRKLSGRVLPPIPFERPEISDFKKGEGQTYKLRNDPSNSTSPTYDVTIRYFSSGSCEEFLIFETDMKRVFRGQGVSTGPGKFEVARRLLIGGALTTFNQALDGTETLESFKTCMNAVRESIFPLHACVLQKKAMRQGMRKPAGVPIKQFVDRMAELNAYLTRFPPISSSRVADGFAPEEFVEILENSIPNSWKAQMTVQGFQPHESDVKDFVNICLRFEEVERHDPKKSANQKEGSKNVEKSNKKKRDHVETKKRVNMEKPPAKSSLMVFVCASYITSLILCRIARSFFSRRRT
jgi:hypothetical protein